MKSVESFTVYYNLKNLVADI